MHYLVHEGPGPLDRGPELFLLSSKNDSAKSLLTTVARFLCTAVFLLSGFTMPILANARALARNKKA